MKHHLYQIYYGGWKIKINNQFYCEECHKISHLDKFTLEIHRNKTQIITRQKNTDSADDK